MHTTRLLFAGILLFVSQQLLAQDKNDKKDKKTSITIVTEENGKKTTIDTTFVNASQSDINAFLKKQGMMKEKAPLPPAPPAPPKSPKAPKAGVPPAPPAPPAEPDENGSTHSYSFSFDMKDFDDDFQDELEDALSEAREAMDKARIHMRISMDNHERMKEDRERMRDDQEDVMDDDMERMIQEKVHKEVQKEIKKIHRDDDDGNDDNDNKKIEKRVIKKKTSATDWDRNSNRNYTWNSSTPAEVRSVYAIADDGSDPVLLTENIVGPPMAFSSHYSYCTDSEKKESKFKMFLKDLKEKFYP
jgi:hypothetical protein